MDDKRDGRGKKGIKMERFQRDPLSKKFQIRFVPTNEEEKKLMDEVEEVVYKLYIDNSFFRDDETKILAKSLYTLGMEYVKLKHKYALEKARFERLLKELRSLHE